MDKAYQDVEKILMHLCHRCCETHAAAVFEELLSEAYLLYAKARLSFDESKKVQFSSWVYTKVYYGLRDYLRKEAKHQPQLPVERAAQELPEDSDRDVLVRLALLHYTTPARTRKRVMRETRDRGWTEKRQQEAVRSVRLMLQQ